MKLMPGDICRFRRSNGRYGFSRVLSIDDDPRLGVIYSLEKFNVHTTEPVSAEDADDVEELKTLPRNGHFPIVEARVLEVAPKRIGHMPVAAGDLEGYAIWREAFDAGEGGVFTIPLEEI